MDWFYSLLTDTSSIAHTALIYTAIITLLTRLQNS